MKGMDRAGRAVAHSRRAVRRPVPPGPLGRHQVADLQARIAGGLRTVGYTVGQIAQVMRCSAATAERDLRRAGPIGTRDDAGDPIPGPAG
jgi:hypothetical protein